MKSLALCVTLALFATPVLADPNGAEVAGSTERAPQQYELAMMYFTGDGVPQDNDKAIELLANAADQGFAAAQFRLAMIHLNSNTPAHDYVEAARLFGLAAEQDDPRAQHLLALMYERGDGVPRDLVQAHLWFDLAAAAGFDDAVESRDELSLEMTIDEITEARRLFHERADMVQVSAPAYSD